MRRAGDAERRELDQELVTRFVTGDRGAFFTIFKALRQEVFAVVQRMFRSPFDQEEAFQEAWLQVYRARERFDVNRHGEIVGWVRQVARNRCIDLIKARARRPEVPVEDLEPHGDASQLSSAIGAQLRQRLSEFVDRLDVEGQRFFKLCFVEELEHEAIAGRLGISVRRSKYLKKKLLQRMLRSPALRRAAEAQ